jgi:hypothetical protein
MANTPETSAKRRRLLNGEDDETGVETYRDSDPNSPSLSYQAEAAAAEEEVEEEESESEESESEDAPSKGETVEEVEEDAEEP